MLWVLKKLIDAHASIDYGYGAQAENSAIRLLMETEQSLKSIARIYAPGEENADAETLAALGVLVTELHDEIVPAAYALARSIEKITLKVAVALPEGDE